MAYTPAEQEGSWGSPTEWTHTEWDEEVDVSSEFTCYLCNGNITLLGSVVIGSRSVTFINAAGLLMESDTIDMIVSVNELEPPRDHALFISFKERYVMLSHLLRKEKLVEFFKGVGVYQDDFRLPPEAIGFYEPEYLNQSISREEYPPASSHYTTSPSSSSPYYSYSTAVPVDDTRGHGSSRTSYDTRQDRLHTPVAAQTGVHGCPHHNPHCPYHQLHSHPPQQQQQDVSYTFRYNNTRAIKQMSKEPPTQLPQTDPFPNLPSSSSSSQSPPSQQKHTQPKEEEEAKPIDKPSLLSGLKMLFPSHPIDKLRSVLEEEGYNMDNAITSLLEHDELANAPKNRGGV